MNETPDEIKQVATDLGLWLLMAYEAEDVYVAIIDGTLTVNGSHPMYGDQAERLRRYLGATA